MTTSQTTPDTVRQVVDRQLNFAVHGYELGADDDLWALGMTSLACVGLMLAIENTFAIELPENLLSENTFRSISTITAAVERVLGAKDTALA